MKIAAVLREIAETEDRAIVAEGNQVYIGNRRSSWRTLKALLQCGVVSGQLGGGFQRFTINDSGEAVMRRPELADELRNAYLSHDGPFTIRDDRVVQMSEPPMTDKRP